MKREELLKHAGEMVIIHYGDDCFVIGWFFAMDVNDIHLKITSTKFETYESRSVFIDVIKSIQKYEMN